MRRASPLLVVVAFACVGAGCGPAPSAVATTPPPSDFARRAPHVFDLFARVDEARIVALEADPARRFAPVARTGAGVDVRIGGRLVLARSEPLGAADVAEWRALVASATSVRPSEESFDPAAAHVVLVQAGERTALVALHRSEPRLTAVLSSLEQWVADVPEGRASEMRRRAAAVVLAPR